MNTRINFQVVKDARGLASGTIAGLIGSSNYEKIDAAQNSFVEFCDTHEGLNTWVEAWTAYRLINERPFQNNSLRFKIGDPSWTEVSQVIYWEQLTCLPPAAGSNGCFAVGEPQTHTQAGPIHSIFIIVGRRYFCRLAPLSSFNPGQYESEVTRQFFK